MSIGALIAVLFWCGLVAFVAWDEARREQPKVDDAEARRAFTERLARELAGS